MKLGFKQTCIFLIIKNMASVILMYILSLALKGQENIESNKVYPCDFSIRGLYVFSFVFFTISRSKLTE